MRVDLCICSSLLGVARSRQTGSISEFISHLSSIHFIYTKLIIYSLSTLVLQAFKTVLRLVIILHQLQLVILSCFQDFIDVLVSMQLQLVIESL